MLKTQACDYHIVNRIIEIRVKVGVGLAGQITNCSYKCGRIRITKSAKLKTMGYY
jgi:hypothetical protein